ncbi:MAG: hypothetical protein HMLIMOIP_002473 [Candidatus Nitrosomirales archaeon]|jgi:hypothetical protein
METKAKRLRKYSTIGLGAMLVMAFVLVQPTMQTAYAVGLAQNEVPAYDDCNHQGDEGEDSPDDGISMNTVRNKDIVKTIHAEKEIFHCFLEQGGLEVIVDLTTYLEVYENITSQEVIETNAFSTTCLKDGPTSSSTATVIDCKSEEISTSPVFVGSECTELQLEFPQEMNTVTKGKIAKTMESQKEVFICYLNGTFKKVDIVLFTEIYEDLNTQETTSVQFLSARCVVLSDDDQGDLQDAFVESCIFTEIEN